MSTSQPAMPTPANDLRSNTTWAFICCLLAATLVMGAGWGIRGSFGHSRGAMMPGAMLGLVIACCAGRSDWWQRAPLIGLLAGIGWAFGGASSYGLLVGYTMKPELSTSVYGYFGLMVVGCLYSGIGCGLLGLALTQSRRFLEAAMWPMIIIYSTWLVLDWTGVTGWSLDLVAKDPDRPEETAWLFDTLWICALATIPLSAAMCLIPRWRGPATLFLLMSLGWWLSIGLLIGAAGLRINTGRNDSWAGVLGILLGLMVYLVWQRNRAALMLVGYGLVSGAVGFPLGQLLHALGLSQWGPFGSVPFLAELGHWTVMEQTFGYLMGFGAALGCMRLVRGGLAAAPEDAPGGWLNAFSVWVLLGGLLAINSRTNFRNWMELELLTPTTMNQPTELILNISCLIWLGIFAWIIWMQQRGKVDLCPASSFGRSQLLAIVMIVAVFLLYLLLPSLRLPTWLMIVAALMIGILCIVHARPAEVPPAELHDCRSSRWNLGWGFVVSCICVPLLIAALGFITVNIPRP
jgi:hypothetical protein